MGKSENFKKKIKKKKESNNSQRLLLLRKILQKSYLSSHMDVNVSIGMNLNYKS